MKENLLLKYFYKSICKTVRMYPDLFVLLYSLRYDLSYEPDAAVAESYSENKCSSSLCPRRHLS